MTSSSPSPATGNTFTVEIDYSIWKAIAGSSVKVPSPGSRVYYFPEGHAEHVNNFNLVSIPSSTSSVTPVSLETFYHCRVIRVQFLADPQSEQVIVKLLLLPNNGYDDGGDMRDANLIIKEFDGEEGKGEVVEDDGTDVASFSKILTPSDANNGGGFSVPRSCADSIFPPLDYDVDPPVQNLSITDINGKVFEFRHIFRGTPRRHLLTTGWTKFVNSKKLVAGDLVVFMRKKSTGELFVGVRRALKGPAGTSSRCSFAAIGAGAVTLDQNATNNGGNIQGFWGTDKGKPVLQAVEMATKGMPFEVLYYPRPEWADFVVNAETVESSMNVRWNTGTRIKICRETNNAPRMTTCSHGTILSINDPRNGCFPWRMLQIKWDENDILKNVSRVSPWEVEYVSPTPTPKKIKGLHNAEFSPSEGEELFQLEPLVSNSEMGCLNPLLLDYTSSASMQGARQDQFSVSSISNFKGEVIQPTWSDGFMNRVIKPNYDNVSTELNICSLQSENLSPDSQSSVHYSGSELAGKVGANISRKHVSVIQLFGKIIRKEEPAEDSFDYTGCTEGESEKVHEDVEGGTKDY